jgi:AraC-like DNA-binding protein
MATQGVSELTEQIIEEIKLKGFKVHEMANVANLVSNAGRRDIYKIALSTADMTIQYGDQTIHVNGTVLTFANPSVPHSVVLHKLEKSYACLFTEDFIMSKEWTDHLRHAPYFSFDGIPVIYLNRDQQVFITSLYKKMLSIHNSTDEYKHETLRKCVELIFYEALSIHPQAGQQQNAATRLNRLFTDLLERQFPIERADHPLKLRTAQDFAEALSVHVNYLNRSIKEVTGKPTSAVIAERIGEEAKALLQHTDWSVADIAYGLGFEYPTYFNNYFKRVTGHIPKSFRKANNN